MVEKIFSTTIVSGSPSHQGHITCAHCLQLGRPHHGCYPAVPKRSEDVRTDRQETILYVMRAISSGHIGNAVNEIHRQLVVHIPSIFKFDQNDARLFTNRREYLLHKK